MSHQRITNQTADHSILTLSLQMKAEQNLLTKQKRRLGLWRKSQSEKLWMFSTLQSNKWKR